MCEEGAEAEGGSLFGDFAHAEKETTARLLILSLGALYGPHALPASMNLTVVNVLKSG